MFGNDTWYALAFSCGLSHDYACWLAGWSWDFSPLACFNHQGITPLTSLRSIFKRKSQITCQRFWTWRPLPSSRTPGNFWPNKNQQRNTQFFWGTRRDTYIIKVGIPGMLSFWRFFFKQGPIRWSTQCYEDWVASRRANQAGGFVLQPSISTHLVSHPLGNSSMGCGASLILAEHRGSTLHAVCQHAVCRGK